MKQTLLIVLFLVVSGVSNLAAEPPRHKVTVLVRGVHCADCVKAVQEQISRLKGVKFVSDDLKAGKAPRYFSDPFEIEVGGSLDDGIGAVARAVSKAKTAYRDKVPPRLHLVLFTDFAINESSVSKLRGALQNVNGVLPEEAGGLGGFPQKQWYWVRLEPAGGADLKEILTAAKDALDVRLQESEG